MTETGGGVVYDGRPLANVECRVIDGEIQLRCPMLLREYRDGTDPRQDDGWYPTGDGGTFENGLVRVDGRLDDAIVTGGEKELLMKKKLLARYRSPEAKGLPEGLRDKDGLWSAGRINQFIIGYNTSMVSGDKVPKDWWDLLDPMWKGGQIGVDRDATVWYAALLQYWGREKGIDFMKRLSAQEPHLERGNTLRTQMMAAGQFPFAIVHAHKVEIFKALGAPLDWVTTADPIVTQPHVLAVSSHAPHPNTARLFLDYAVSKKGQLIIQEHGSMSSRPDIPPPAPQLDQSKLKLHYVDPALADDYSRYHKEYQEIFQ